MPSPRFGANPSAGITLARFTREWRNGVHRQTIDAWLRAHRIPGYRDPGTRHLWVEESYVQRRTRELTRVAARVEDLEGRSAICGRCSVQLARSTRTDASLSWRRRSARWVRRTRG